MTDREREIVKELEAEGVRLLEKLQERGGRGVALAEHVDRLTVAVAALRGNLCCPICDAQITGNGD